MDHYQIWMAVLLTSVWVFAVSIVIYSIVE
nr:MAG TPA: TMEM156 protein family protein [Caudoviricetes sp.]